MSDTINVMNLIPHHSRSLYFTLFRQRFSIPPSYVTKLVRDQTVRKSSRKNNNKRSQIGYDAIEVCNKHRAPTP